MLTIPNYLVKIGATIWLRATIGLFFYLSLIFVRMFISVGAQDHPYLTVICGIAHHATAIVIFHLLYGRYSVGRDIIFLSLVGWIITLGYFLISFVGVDAAQLQHLAAKSLNGLIVLRCIFLTDRDLFATFSPIEIAKKWLLKRQWYVNSYINTLTVAVFVLCAVPLFTMMVLINTDEMRASGICVVLFAFGVAFENAKRYAATTPSVAEVGPADKKSIEDEEHAMGMARVIYFVVALVIAGVITKFADDERRFFNVGYASGYSDAKSGAEPKKEKDFQKALWCNMVKINGQTNPPGMSCDDGPQ